MNKDFDYTVITSFVITFVITNGEKRGDRSAQIWNLIATQLQLLSAAKQVLFSGIEKVQAR